MAPGAVRLIGLIPAFMCVENICTETPLRERKLTNIFEQIFLTGNHKKECLTHQIDMKRRTLSMTNSVSELRFAFS